jgi:hypothetical protein
MFTIPNEQQSVVYLYGGKNRRPQAEVDSVDVAILVQAHNGEGVLDGCAVTAKAPESTSVAVASGNVQKSDGTSAAVAAGDVNCGAAHATLPRWDLVIANVNTGAKSAVNGTAAAIPVFPSGAAVLGTSVVLAAIWRAALDDTISDGPPGASGDVCDKRAVVEAAGATIEVQEDTAKEGDADTLDFTEPGANLVSFAGTKATVNMALYALLAGRTGGQTLIGGTGVFDRLTLQSTSFALRYGVTLAAGEHFEWPPITTPTWNPAGNAIQTYAQAGALKGRTSFGGMMVDFSLGALVSAFQGIGQVGRIDVPPASAAWNTGGTGLLGALVQHNAAPTIGSGSAGRYLRATTPASIGSERGFYTNGTCSSKECRPWFQLAAKVGQTANTRLFIGLSDQSLSTMISADSPAAGSFVGLAYSSTRSPNWFFIFRGTAGFTSRDTLVAVAANTLVYARILNPQSSSWVIQLFDAALSQLYGTFVVAGFGPATATQISYMSGIEALANSAVTLDHHNCHSYHDR